MYAFEPDAEAFSYLTHNTERLLNVQIFPYAVSDTDGEATFYHLPKATSSHSLLPLPNAELSTVKTVTLDSFIQEKIDGVKIDIEGAEDKVFRGMKKHIESSLFAVFEYTIGEGEPLVEELKKTGDIYAISTAGELVSLSEIGYYKGGRGGNPYSNVVYLSKSPSAV